MLSQILLHASLCAFGLPLMVAWHELGHFLTGCVIMRLPLEAFILGDKDRPMIFRIGRLQLRQGWYTNGRVQSVPSNLSYEDRFNTVRQLGGLVGGPLANVIGVPLFFHLGFYQLSILSAILLYAALFGSVEADREDCDGYRIWTLVYLLLWPDKVNLIREDEE